MLRINFILILFFICFLGFSQKEGKLDKSFGNKGLVITDLNHDNDYCKSMVIQKDGKIILAGFTDNGVNEDFAICRFNTNGLLDTLFGKNGKVITPIGPEYDIANSVKLQSNSKIIVAGHIGNETDEDFALVRYNQDGSIDKSFGKEGIAITSIEKPSDIIVGIQILPDDKIIAAGKTFDGKQSNFAITKYLQNGQIDTQFGDSGIVITDIENSDATATSIVIQKDGKIIIGGDLKKGIYTDFVIVRYLPNGLLDTTFGKKGIVITSFSDKNDNLTSLLIQPDDKIIASGHVFNNDFSDLAFVRYLKDGTIDTTIGNKGIVIHSKKGSLEVLSASLLQDDGKLILIGNTTKDTITSIEILRYTIYGKLDKTFGKKGKIISKALKNYRYNNAYAAAIQVDGKILISGNVRFGTFTDITLYRYSGRKKK